VEQHGFQDDEIPNEFVFPELLVLDKEWPLPSISNNRFKRLHGKFASGAH
jgi:hypothetical protein